MMHPSTDSKTHSKAEIETTGHEWDGIKEYNNPLPRWWLWTFYLTIIWAVIYMVFFPAIPLFDKATPGMMGYASRHELNNETDLYRALNAPLDNALISTPLEDISENPDLLHYAQIGGAATYRTYCSQCHGDGAAGAKGYPNLLDDDWLWGGKLTAIYQTIAHGIRSEEDDETRFSEMPAFGEILQRDELIDITHYVLSLSGQPNNPSLVSSGKQLFADNCASCHADGGVGDREMGAPNLSDAIWLYGGDQVSILETLTKGRKGMMPAWQNRLTEAQLRQVALYIHQLGGGENE